MRYVMARYEEYQKEMAYRIYVTDRLYVSSDGKRPIQQQRYCEWLGAKVTDTRSGEEIAADVILKAGLVVEE